jgi:integrase
MKKTDKLNFNSTIKFSNDLLNDKQPNQTKRMTEKAFGLLIRLAVKTGIRASDLLNLEYIQFKENREYPNTFTLEYSITKTKSKNIIPVGAELMRIIQVYELECLSEYGYKSKHLFHNSTGKNYTRVWASNKVRKANDSGLLGEIVNVAGMHSLRRTAVIEIFENKQDLRLAQAF